MLANYAKWYSFTPPHWHDFRNCSDLRGNEQPSAFQEGV